MRDMLTIWLFPNTLSGTSIEPISPAFWIAMFGLDIFECLQNIEKSDNIPIYSLRPEQGSPVQR